MQREMLLLECRPGPRATELLIRMYEMLIIVTRRFSVISVTIISDPRSVCSANMLLTLFIIHYHPKIKAVQLTIKYSNL